MVQIICDTVIVVTLIIVGGIVCVKIFNKIL